MDPTIPRHLMRFPRAVWFAAAAVAGGTVAVNGLSPTGSALPDLVIVATLGAVWAAGASAVPPPVLAAAAVAATAATGDPWAIGIGLAVVALAVTWRNPAQQVSGPVLRLRGVVLAAGLAHLLARIRPLGAFGVSTLAALIVAGVLFAVGMRRHAAEDRRVLRRCALSLGGVSLACVVAFGITAVDAGPDLIDGGRAARAALRLADAGELDAARSSFESAATSLRRAHNALDAPWGAPARILPGVAQHQRALRHLAEDAAAASSQITEILARTDYAALGVTEGRIDLDAIRALDEPIRELDTALAALGDRINEVDTEWLLPPITHLVDDLADDVVSKQAQLADLEEAIEQAPSMLGADGPRRYFVALTTPAEARGLGGLMGNWAEITVDRGRIELTGFGRHQDLLQAAPTTPRLTGMPDEYLAQYGAYVLDERGSLTVGPGVWPNLTVAAHFPWVAESIASLYPQSGGRELDGVFVMDVYTVSTLMRLTGPVSVPALGVDVTPDNALQYLLRDQYLVTDLDNRVDLLETLARTTIDRILAGSLPPPPQLAALLRPLVQQHRLAAWARRPAEQEVFRNANMSKELNAETGAHQIAYTLYNANGNKIDAYLDASADYDFGRDPETGTLVGRLTLRLRNAAPASGLPDYVIGNLVDLPQGTNRMILSVLSSGRVRFMGTDIGNLSWITGAERGLATASTTVELAPGEERVITMEVEESVSEDGFDPEMVVLDLPPAANPIPTSVRVDGKLRTRDPISVSGRFAFAR